MHSRGDGETHSRVGWTNAQEEGTEKRTGGGGRRNAQEGGRRNAHFKIETDTHTDTRTFWLFKVDLFLT